MRRVVVVFFVIGVLLFFMNYLGSIFFGYPGGDLLSLRQWYELRTQYSEGGERGTRPPSPGHQEWKCPARSAKSDVQVSVWLAGRLIPSMFTVSDVKPVRPVAV